MVLDKRTGLHKVPAHHLQTPQPTARPSYNSMDWEPTSGTEDHEVKSSVQKRKSQREASSTEPPKTGLAGLGPVLNGDMVKAVKSSVKAAKEAFRSPQPAAGFAAAASAAAAAALSVPTATPEPAFKKVKKGSSKRETHPTAPGPSTLKLEGNINEAAPMWGGGVTPARPVPPTALPQPLASSHLNLASANSGLATSGSAFLGNQILAPPNSPVPFMTGMNPGPRRVVVPKYVNEALPPPASSHVSPKSSSTQENSDAENVPPFGGPSAAQIWVDTDSEPQQEAGIGEFVAAYSEVLFCVDFVSEREFFLEFRKFQAAASQGSLPCLGRKGSGCNKSEEASLRRYRERAQGNDSARLGLFTDADHVAVNDAADCSAAAEVFLAQAVIARVPVPLGAVEGQWELFCPQYAAEHMDRYGAGERILTLQSVPSPLSAVDHRAIYKGQLYLSPRATLYTLDNFAVPPHASFRTTAVQTTVDKYEMDIVFLGNGYLVLRIDMGLMLTGKETRDKDGQPVVMEFLGIHQAALVWKVEDD